MPIQDPEKKLGDATFHPALVLQALFPASIQGPGLAQDTPERYINLVHVHAQCPVAHVLHALHTLVEALVALHALVVPGQDLGHAVHVAAQVHQGAGPGHPR